MNRILGVHKPEPLLHDIERAPLQLFIDAPNVLTHHPQHGQLEGANEKNDGD